MDSETLKKVEEKLYVNYRLDSAKEELAQVKSEHSDVQNLIRGASDRRVPDIRRAKGKRLYLKRRLQELRNEIGSLIAQRALTSSDSNEDK